MNEIDEVGHPPADRTAREVVIAHPRCVLMGVKWPVLAVVKKGFPVRFRLGLGTLIMYPVGGGPGFGRFDAKQLAEWITTLQPRFGPVWEFHAWNMAYNISAAIPASEKAERRRWARNGYELLRDKGIELNPKDISLYRELGRIFQHKISGVTDDTNKYYKLQLALSIEPLLGPATNEYFKLRLLC